MNIYDKIYFYLHNKCVARYFFVVIVVTTVFLSPSLVFAKTVCFLSSSKSPLYNNIVNIIKKNVKDGSDNPVTFEEVYADRLNPTEIERIKHSDLLVTVGLHAMLSTNQLAITPPILATLVPSQSFKQQISTLKKLNKKVSAIYIDSPPERQILLAKLLLGNLQKLAIVISDESPIRKKDISSIVKKFELRSKIVEVSAPDKIIKKISFAIKDSDALLALPDPLIFNRITARNILLTTYRKRIPVIGYSKNYVKAGALAATFSTPEQIARKTSKEIIKQLNSTSSFKLRGQFPDEFEVAVNYNVARSLGIHILPEAVLKKKIESLLADE